MHKVSCGVGDVLHQVYDNGEIGLLLPSYHKCMTEKISPGATYKCSQLCFAFVLLWGGFMREVTVNEQLNLNLTKQLLVPYLASNC